MDLTFVNLGTEFHETSFLDGCLQAVLDHGLKNCCLPGTIYPDLTTKNKSFLVSLYLLVYIQSKLPKCKGVRGGSVTGDRRLEESNYTGSLPKGPDISTFCRRIYLLQFLSYVYV